MNLNGLVDGSASRGFVTNPEEIPRFHFEQAESSSDLRTPSGQVSISASFWNEVLYSGGNWIDATTQSVWHDIVNISGVSGLFTGAIGPALNTTAAAGTWQAWLITIDGVTCAQFNTYANQYDRCYIGWWLPQNDATAAGDGYQGAGSYSASDRGTLNSSATRHLLIPASGAPYSVIMLPEMGLHLGCGARFYNDLRVRVYNGGAAAHTSSYGERAAAFYRTGL